MSPSAARVNGLNHAIYFDSTAFLKRFTVKVCWISVDTCWQVVETKNSPTGAYTPVSTVHCFVLVIIILNIPFFTFEMYTSFITRDNCRINIANVSTAESGSRSNKQTRSRALPTLARRTSQKWIWLWQICPYQQFSESGNFMHALPYFACYCFHSFECETCTVNLYNMKTSTLTMLSTTRTRTRARNVWQFYMLYMFQHFWTQIGRASCRERV